MINSPQYGHITIDRNFVIAGLAFFEASNPKKETHQFKAVTRPDKQDSTKQITFLYYRPERSTPQPPPPNLKRKPLDYQYLGILHQRDGRLIVTSEVAVPSDDITIKVLNWILKILWTGETIPDGYILDHKGKCGKCGRSLSSEPNNLPLGDPYQPYHPCA